MRLLNKGIIWLLLAVAVAPAFGNVKLSTERTTAGQTFADTIYIKGKRQRSETMNGAMVNITQCDAGRQISLNPALKTYSVSYFEETSKPDRTANAEIAANLATTRGGTVTITSTLKDTGERKQVFGYTARRIKGVVVYESSADACTVSNSKFETDGWYIDETFGFDCGDRQVRYEAPQVKSGGCKDRFVTKSNGTAKKGFAIYEKTLIYSGNSEPFEIVTEVKELSKETLDDSLFEIPADYREVNDVSDLYAAGPPSEMPVGSRSEASSLPIPSGVSNEPIAANAQTAAKKAGIKRIGIANVKVASAGESMPAQELAAAFRNTLAEYLKTPDIEVVMLESKLPSAVQAEAAKLECDAVVYGIVSHKQGGGGFGGMFGKVIAPAVGSVGIGHTGSIAGNIAGQAATYAIINAGSLAANTKAKDEMSFGLELVRSTGDGLKKQYKRKAKSAGEDLITGIVEEAATEIVSLLSK
ncbi:MAG: hypothetical protein DWQ47_07640 [Acidobacteria bacterium]|nr:MAG: hypothetical protein DWQ32_15740 [Acidobacteriota bacterium]REJ99207.1 MAG: hypothetical protein DWQ38_14235 [Acidobacteriota bacterium]REK16072.1 MAG: hypothetical protein DWQ43_03450 [Acidobacteriota bacterium]REK43753.1 MAG: hypothetical protein DWQ47_07640 [Acidobacteriota bacterium]